MTNLENKVAVITGAANGLGKALAIELHKHGCHLALIDIDKEGLNRLKDTIGPRSVVSIYHTDISNEGSVAACRAGIISQHGKIDLLFNNAAVSISMPFSHLTMEDYKRLFEINFWGTVSCTKHFLPDLLKSKDAYLVNIISGFALAGFPGKVAYGSSKSAIMGFTQSLRTELAGTSVHASLVIPPPLDTGIILKGGHIDDRKKALEIAFVKRHAMPVEQAAQKIISLMLRKRSRILIGRQVFWADLMVRLFPALTHKLIEKNQRQFDFI